MDLGKNINIIYFFLNINISGYFHTSCHKFIYSPNQGKVLWLINVPGNLEREHGIKLHFIILIAQKKA